MKSLFICLILINVCFANNIKVDISNNVQNIVVKNVSANSDGNNNVLISINYSINNQNDDLNIALTTNLI
jgi:hypothetical protein